MKKEYCYKVKLNPDYIMYVGSPFGCLWYVFVTNESHTVEYSVYGGYKNIGTAVNRMLKSARSYKSNDINLYYASRELIGEFGGYPFGELHVKGDLK